MNIKAFTLAEVLITFGIIGIVAALTLPALVQNNRNKELQTGLKRSYSTLGQALNMYQAENGERITPDMNLQWSLKTLLMKYLKTIKDCGYGSKDDSSCIPNYGTDNENNSTNYTTYTGKKLDLQFFDDGQFILADGSLVLLESISSQKLYISVDVNGYKKKPNRLGQDLFMFQVDKKGNLRPMGAAGTDFYDKKDSYCSSTSNNTRNGMGCTYKALTEPDYFKNLP